MTAGELIEELNKFYPDQKVMILDGFNGGGVPRTLNLGPVTHTVTHNESLETDDCENIVGEHIILIGYGCY
jgi:hypothetical protein